MVYGSQVIQELVLADLARASVGEAVQVAGRRDVARLFDILQCNGMFGQKS